MSGFEILLPPAAERRLASRADAAAVAHQLALLASAAPLAAVGRAAMLRVTAAMLGRPAVLEAAPAGALLVVDDLKSLPPTAAQALRAKGVLLGVLDGPPAREPVVDFVLLDAGGGIDTLLLSAQRWHELWPRLTTAATGLSHLGDVERVLRSGIHLAGGQIGRLGGTLPPRELGSAAHRICDLLNHLALDRDTALIADAVRGDVALAYRLLRYVNSPAIGLARSVETVDQAVFVLGRAELYRWLSVQLMAAAEARLASRALQEAALARGRLLESVAQVRGDAEPGAFFTLGLLSMIEPLLQVPMAVALEPLRLGETARDALLNGRGPWADRLALAEAIDAGGAEAAEPLAHALAVDALLPDLAERAWQWAAQVSASADAR